MRPSVHGASPEKKGPGFGDVYLKAAFFGAIVALALIGGGIGLKFTIELIIKYWIWVLVAILGFFLIKKFIKRRSSR